MVIPRQAQNERKLLVAVTLQSSLKEELLWRNGTEIEVRVRVGLVLEGREPAAAYLYGGTGFRGFKAVVFGELVGLARRRKQFDGALVDHSLAVADA